MPATPDITDVKSLSNNCIYGARSQGVIKKCIIKKKAYAESIKHRIKKVTKIHITTR